MMKKRSIVLLLFLAISGIVTPLKADDVKLILKDEKPVSNDPRPRSLDQIPIACYMDPVMGFVSFSFSYDFGEVDITIDNQDTGVTITTSADTADGSIIIPFSATPGHYFISILTESGTEYVGEFEL